MIGTRHLIQCHCRLPFKNKDMYHKFPVYSKFDKLGNVLKKYVKCNNCETIHLVEDFCKSQIVSVSDSDSFPTIADYQYSIPDKYYSYLIKNSIIDISIYEMIEDIISEKAWGTNVTVKRDVINKVESVKIIEIISEERFRIKSESIDKEVNL